MSEESQSLQPELSGGFATQTVMDDPAYASPIVVPSVARYVSRWRFVMVVAGMWLAGAAAGAGLYYWWYHSLDKALPVFTVLVFVVACIVGSLLTAMVQDRPGIAATSLALMSTPLAMSLGAAGVYVSFAVGWIAT